MYIFSRNQSTKTAACASVCGRRFWRPCKVQNMGVWQMYPFRYCNKYIFAGCMFSQVGCCLNLYVAKSLRLWEWKLSSLGSEREREFVKGADYIGNHVTWLAPNARFIFAEDNIKTRGRSWKHTANDLLCPIRFPKLFNLLTSYYFCFGKKWVLDPIFRNFSCPTWSLLTI